MWKKKSKNYFEFRNKMLQFQRIFNNNIPIVQKSSQNYVEILKMTPFQLNSTRNTKSEAFISNRNKVKQSIIK